MAALDGRSDFTSLASGDLDGDGMVDLAALTGEGTLEVFLGQGERAFAKEHTPEAPETSGGCTGWHVEIRDLNADGLGDIVAAFAGEAQGMTGVKQVSVNGCPGEGSLRVWNTRIRTE